jgi:acetyl esterase/lipase
VPRSSVLLILLVAFAPTCGGPQESAPPSEDSKGDASSSKGETSSGRSSEEESGGGSNSATGGDPSTGSDTSTSTSTSTSGDGDGEPLTIEVLELAYAADPAQKLDLYLPQPRPVEPMPIVVLAHGGLWQGGDKSALANLCENVIEISRGTIACASINYRLSGSLGGVCEGAGVDTYMQQLADFAAAHALLQAQARTHGLDPTRMLVGGHSAGAQLAHTLNLRWSEFTSMAPAGAIGFEGIYDIPGWDAYDAQIWNGQFICATRRAFGGAPDSGSPCIDAQHQAPCWLLGSPTYLAEQAGALGLGPVGDVLLVQSPGDDWVDVAQVPSFAAAMSAAFPGLEVVSSIDGSCGQGSHDGVLSDPALAGCIVNFVADL